LEKKMSHISLKCKRLGVMLVRAGVRRWSSAQPGYLFATPIGTESFNRPTVWKCD
jgi:hypothetical protein